MTRSYANRFSIFWFRISILPRVHPSKFQLCSVDLYMHFLSRLVNKPDTYAVLSHLYGHSMSFLREHVYVYRYFFSTGKAAMHISVSTYGCWQRRNTSDGCIDI